MITVEINRSDLADARLSLDAEGVGDLAYWLQHCWERDDDVMLTPWGICEDDISAKPVSGEPYAVVEILRLFWDSPRLGFLQGRPAEYRVEILEKGYELDLIATKDVLCAWTESLKTLKDVGDSVVWEVAEAACTRKRKEDAWLPLPPARIEVRLVEAGPCGGTEEGVEG